MTWNEPRGVVMTSPTPSAGKPMDCSKAAPAATVHAPARATAGLVIVHGAVAAYNRSRPDAAAANREARHLDDSLCWSAARIHQDTYSASANTMTIGQTTR